MFSFKKSIWCKSPITLPLLKFFHTVNLNKLTEIFFHLQEFYIPMKTAGLLTPEQLQTIFCNIDELRSVNAKFADQLRDTMQLAMEQGDEVRCLKTSMMMARHGNAFHITGPFVRGIHQWLMDSPHKWPVMQNFDGLFVVHITSCWTNSQIVSALRCHVMSLQ